MKFTTGDTVVTNIRHQQELLNTQNDLNRVLEGIDKGISNDLLAMDIPAKSGQVPYFASPRRGYPYPTAGLLDNIFSKFCLPDLWRVLESRKTVIKLYIHYFRANQPIRL